MSVSLIVLQNIALLESPTELRFAEADSRPELHAAFESLAAVVAPFCADVDVATETFWAALHGLTELERSGRIRPAARVERVRRVVRAFVGFRRPQRPQLITVHEPKIGILLPRSRTSLLMTSY